MHKKLLSIFFIQFICIYYAHAQHISFQLFRVNPCTGSTDLEISKYYLVSESGLVYESADGTVWLDSLGSYRIINPTQRRINFGSVLITDSVNTHLHYDKKINIKFDPRQGGQAYFGCKGILNGVHEDVYENGVIQMRGNFKNGAPKDSLTFFYRNGHVFQSVIFLRKKIYIREYDSLSVLSKITHILDDSYFGTEYDATSFYPNGRLKKVEKVRKKITRSKEYYPDKKLKNEVTPSARTDYDINGKVSARYTWKNITYEKGLILQTTFEVVKTTYDQFNNKTATIKYHTVQWANTTLPSFDVNDASYFVYWKQYATDGQETVLLKNISRRELVKSGNLYYQ